MQNPKISSVKSSFCYNVSFYILTYELFFLFRKYLYTNLLLVIYEVNSFSPIWVQILDSSVLLVVFFIRR